MAGTTVNLGLDEPTYLPPTPKGIPHLADSICQLHAGKAKLRPLLVGCPLLLISISRSSAQLTAFRNSDGQSVPRNRRPCFPKADDQGVSEETESRKDL